MSKAGIKTSGEIGNSWGEHSPLPPIGNRGRTIMLLVSVFTILSALRVVTASPESYDDKMLISYVRASGYNEVSAVLHTPIELAEHSSPLLNKSDSLYMNNKPFV